MPKPCNGGDRSSLLYSVDSRGTIHSTYLARPHTTAGSLCSIARYYYFPFSDLLCNVVNFADVLNNTRFILCCQHVIYIF